MADKKFVTRGLNAECSKNGMAYIRNPLNVILFNPNLGKYTAKIASRIDFMVT
jgi:hypothetical protein